MDKDNGPDFKYKVIGFFIFVGLIILLYNLMFGDWGNTAKQSNEPDEIDLMSYAQLVLKDNLNNPKYSNYKEDYDFIGTGLRRKIEGRVNNQDFYIIIEFVDDTYEEYDLISLQVGNNIIYKK